MKKEDLRGGNIVEFRGGGLYLVGYCPIDRLLVSLFNGGSFEIEKYNDNLNNIESKSLDIMKIYKDYTLQDLLWERKQPELTDAEKAVLSNIDKDYKYIARDKDGILRITAGERFIKVENHWFSKFYSSQIFPYTNLFQFIKWEDEKPYLIEDLLRKYE